MISMKKGCIALLLILMVICVPLSAALAAEVIAYFGEVGGEVSVRRVNPETTMQAQVGMFLDAGDTVKTGEGGYASIIFQDDGSWVKLGENSQLTLNATRREQRLEKSSFLETGKLWAKVTKKKGSLFQIKTPTSVASVKGTKFILEEKQWGETWLWVLDESVFLSNDSEEKEVKEGQKGKATKEKIEIEDLQKDDLPLEPGRHELIFYLQKGGESALQKELHIELEKK
jgi:hypothetical protein